MAHKGKLNNCPFHVETEEYIYAIEHENQNYNLHEEQVMCEFYRATGKLCALWNSGFQKCCSYKCPYVIKKIQRETLCTMCAYYYQDQCRHPKFHFTKEFIKTNARFCCYYCGQEEQLSIQ